MLMLPSANSLEPRRGRRTLCLFFYCVSFEFGNRNIVDRSAVKLDRATVMADLVAVWDVSLSDGLHKVEFEHGTTSGMRVIRVDNKELLRRNWMFKLVGREHFKIGAYKASINIDASGGFSYEYTLEVNGKTLKELREQRSKTARVWLPVIDGYEFRIVFEKDSMDVWCNGQVLETAGEFVDDGTETHFTLPNDLACYIKAVSSGKKKEGIIHSLVINDNEIPETLE